IGMGYVFEENWYEIIREKIDNFSYKKLREIMSKNFKGDKKVSINKIKNKTLTTLSKEWTLGDLIKIFDSLNIDIKTKITEYMFSRNSFYKGNNFVNSFIDIMNSFKMVRNRICHNEPIYNFETYFYDIYDFLYKNNIPFKIRYGRVKVNINIVIECLAIFNNSIYKNN
ncbi:MAG: Abi family protein, partial [Ureaplasma sp.]|nr:Abi family protein [Ureaplasma sp.]